MPLEDAVSADERDRLAACVRVVDRYLTEELDALVRAARRSLLAAAQDALDPEEERRLTALVGDVEAFTPAAGDAFRTAVLARLKAPEENQSDESLLDDGASLTLVDTGKVGDWLRVREIVERHPEDAKAREAGLCQRLANAAGKSSNPEKAPMSVRGLCALFHASMRHLDSSPEARAAIYDAFEATVVARLGTLVDTLHRILDGSGEHHDPVPDARPASAPVSDGGVIPGLLDDTAHAAARDDPPPPAEASEAAPDPDRASVDPARLLGAIASVERQMQDVSPGRGLEALAELQARLTAALTPPGTVLGEREHRAVNALATLVHQAFAHPDIDPATRARLWKLAPPIALLALQDDDQLDLVLQASRHDPVTGLLDRTAFRVRLQAALDLAAKGQPGFAVCLLGVDGFESVGQRLGQQVAGRGLRVLAELMRRSADASAHLARLRGAEFAVLLPAHHRDSGWRFANRYLSKVNKAHFALAGHEVSLTVSIGVVEPDPSLTTVAQVMRAADAAHRAAVEDGGDCARAHIPESFG